MDRAHCPHCGIPTVPQHATLTDEEATCDSSHARETEERKTEVTNETKKDFFAFTTIGAGGTWTRGTEAAETVQRCAKQVVTDWSSLYEFPGNLNIGLYDVTGFDEITCSSRGVFGKRIDNGKEEEIPLLSLESVPPPKVRKRR